MEGRGVSKFWKSELAVKFTTMSLVPKQQKQTFVNFPYTHRRNHFVAYYNIKTSS